MNNRIGLGYDIHRLVKGRPLVLGGVKIPFLLGLKGHSDADVLIHAICDAMLGSIACNDIGKYFPDTDKKYKGISSMKLLKQVKNIFKKNNYRLVNIDTVLILERPKIILFKKKMIDNISKILKIKKTQINIKATTQEGIGEIGRGKAVAAYAIVLARRNKR